MNPLISVIITVHNLEKYISQCLDSLINQDFENFEIVVIDDASTDKSVEICTDYVHRYPGLVRLVELKPPAELYRAHRAGLVASRGTYIQFVDGDDFLRRGYVLEAADIIRCQAPDVIIGRFTSITEEDALPYKDAELLSSKIDYRSADEVIQYIHSVPSYHLAYWRYIFKRQLVDLHLFESFLEEDKKCPLLDAVVTYRILLSGKSFTLLENPMYVYRSRDNSVSTKKKQRALWNVESFAEFFLLLKSGGYAGEKKKFILSKLKQELKLILGKSDLWDKKDWEYAALLINKIKPDLSGLCGDGLPEPLTHFKAWMETNEISPQTLSDYFKDVRFCFINKVLGKKADTIYIFPCGRFSRDVQRWIKDSRSLNVAFLDNNPEMNGRVIQGSRCFNPELLKSKEEKTPVVLIATIYEELDKRLRGQCLDLGVPEDRVIICCP